MGFLGWFLAGVAVGVVIALLEPEPRPDEGIPVSAVQFSWTAADPGGARFVPVGRA